jgi:hypothetical protein
MSATNLERAVARVVRDLVVQDICAIADAKLDDVKGTGPLEGKAFVITYVDGTRVRVAVEVLP